MKKFRITHAVGTVTGYQSFIVEAKSAAEAVKKYESGEGKFETEELDIQTHKGDPEVEAIDDDES